MDTYDDPNKPTRTRRRFYSEFKDKIANACRQPDASVVGVALAHALNANLVHHWVCLARLHQGQPHTPAFVPLPVFYFAHPYSSWEHGLNENFNGLLRQFIQKGTDLRLITDEDVRRAEKTLNLRPRKCLGFRQPEIVFQKCLQAA